MLKKWLFCSLFVALGIMVGNFQGETAAETLEFSPPVSQIIVQFNEEVYGNQIAAETMNGRIQQLSEVSGVALQYVRPMSGNAHVIKLPLTMPVNEAEAITAKIAQQDDIAYAEPDYILQAIGDAPLRLATPLLTPNDTFYVDQWHYTYSAGTSEGLNLPAAWNITTGISSTVVAVIDTGILNHIDLSGRTAPGYDFIINTFVANDGGGRDADPSDPGDWILANECGFPHAAQNSSWHGTHVAGTIGAATNNSLGVAGVNWNAKILPVRVLGKCGGSTSDIVDGMRWAAGLPVTGVPANANPAQVLNLSLGGSGSCTTSEQNAINEIVAAGSTVVVAAGNDNLDASGFTPASCNGVVTVASNDRGGDKADYSNFGSVVEVTAPGGETTISTNGVLSTLDGGTMGPINDNAYVYYQGTSMAAPHVSGVVSLLIAEYPTLTPGEISQQLQNTARPFPAGSSCNTSICGTGIVDAYNALSTTPPEFHVYLPVILNGSSSVANPFTNPDFENGSTGWVEFSTHGWDIIVQAFPPGVAPRSGSWATWLGGDFDDVSYVQQQVTVPAGSPYLSYWHWIASEDACGFDLGGVIINGSQIVDVYDLCSTMNTSGWVQHTVNLSAYSGQMVTVQIRAETDSSLNSNLFVDDVSFQATASSTPLVPAPTTDSNTSVINREDALR